MFDPAIIGAIAIVGVAILALALMAAVITELLRLLFEILSK